MRLRRAAILVAVGFIVLAGFFLGLRLTPIQVQIVRVVEETAVPTPTRTSIPTDTPMLPPTHTPIATRAQTPTDTPAPTPGRETVALISYHGRYVTAMGEEGDWLLRQEPELGECGRFTLQHLDGGEVALVTCYGLYVTASVTSSTDLDWALRQEPELDGCGRFALHNLGRGQVAFETCAGRYVTAVNDSWGQEWHWLVMAQTYNLDTWETFTLLQP